jgi:hypothetical protein
VGRLGEIFRAHGADYRARFGSRMSLDQLRAMRDIEACHTPAAGEALWRCPDCGKRQFTFLGCGNRHCPACGATRAGQWLQKHSALLLPETVYHLVTFTVPEPLRRLIRSHPRELLEVLMHVSSSTLMDLADNDRWLGAVPGATAVLHTWTRQLEYHPHVHFIVTGGGLNAQGLWREAHPKFLVPVHALSRVFRARFRDALRELRPDLFAQVKPVIWRQSWVVHSKPVGSGQTTLMYLARYVQRVAISERAILKTAPDRITVRYRSSGTNQPRTLRLTPHEFIRRFLHHVLPHGFRKIRYFGLHHSSKRPVLRLLQAAMAIRDGASMPAPVAPLTTSSPRCQHCHTRMQFERRCSPRRMPLVSRGRAPP